MVGGAKGSAWGGSSPGGAGGKAGSCLLTGPARSAREAELRMVFLITSLIWLSGLAWAQDAIAPQPAPAIPSPAPATSSASSVNPMGQRYLVAKDDLLDIYIVDLPDISRTYRIDEDGMLTLPMLPRPLMAAGLTLDQVSKALRKELLEAGLLTDPQVSVTLKSSSWNMVVLSGAAKKPGLYPVYGRTSLLELLTEAEGLSDEAGNTAIITRGQNAPQGPGPNAPQVVGTAQAAENAKAVTSRTVKVNVSQLWQNGDASLDVDLYPGDRVMIRPASLVFIIGAVNRPGGYVLNDQEPMTLLSAVAVSDGPSRNAKTSQAMIIRRDPHAPGGRELIRVDLKKVLMNHAPDQQLVANDILYVPESGVKRTLDTATSSFINAASGVTIYRVAY